MADFIACSSCGERNPVGQSFCRRCQAPLQTEDTITPGQAPTKKVTSELEPILPQWLREARDTARKTAEEENDLAAQPKETKPIPPSEDLLAGLQSQTAEDAEEEMPDWLASITGIAPKPKPSPQASGEPPLETAAFTEPPSAEIEQPDWLKGLVDAQPPAGEKDELTEWFRKESAAESPPLPPRHTPAFGDFSLTEDEENPDWLSRLQDDAQTSSATPALEPPLPDESDTPDWLKQMSAEYEEKPPAAPSSPFIDTPDLPSDTPDWLRNLGETQERTPHAETDASAPFDLPDWMRSEAAESPPIQDAAPKWLMEETESGAESPSWLPPEQAATLLPEQPQGETAARDDVFGGLPDWLKESAPQSTLFDSPEDTPAPPSDATAWQKTFGLADESKPEGGSAEKTAQSFDEPLLPGGSVDDLLAETPDWLSEAMDEPAAPKPTLNTDAIASSDLPSWVQAMRPVDVAPTDLSGDQTLESRGALAGLQGVLPAAPGFTPTSKPKAYSIKLNASDEQLAHAELLQQILSAETEPIPIASYSPLSPSRPLRWIIGLILLLAVLVSLLAPAPIFAMPTRFPNELRDAVSIAQSLPQNAPVLIALDYAPARAGEMETAAAPMLDHMIFFSHPNLTFIATSETGAILAERFIAGPLADHYKNGGFLYSNLGYLPGGQMGIRAFARNPRITAPFDISLDYAWDNPPLAGVASLSQFAALILITDNAEAARMWVEQTEGARGGTPFVVVSSAQAAPMIHPYYDSRQINALVAGVYGGALFEQINSGRPGAARNYWDAYSLGLFSAVLLIAVGSLWNLALMLQQRFAAGESK